MSLWLFLTGIVGVVVGLASAATGLVLEVRRLGTPSEATPVNRLSMLVCYGVGLVVLPLLAAALFTLYTVYR